MLWHCTSLCFRLPKNAATLCSVQHSNLVLTALAYQITGGLSLQCVDRAEG